MKKILSFLLIFVCISCTTKTAVPPTRIAKATVTNIGSSSAVDGLNGLDKVSYTTYADYVDKVAGTNSDNTRSEVSGVHDSNAGAQRAAAAPAPNTAAHYPKGDDTRKDDIIAIYYGNKNRPKAGRNELKKLVTHTFKDGHTEWFFPSFLYVEFKTDEGYKFGDNQPGEKGATNKGDWEWLLNRYFSTAYNGGNFDGLKALDECIEDCKKLLGKPAFKHKVYLTVPSPCTDFTEWGSLRINGRTVKIDFRKREHRLEAVKWFVDEVISRFQAQHYKNITLEGLYWIEETTSVTSWHKDSKTGEWTNMTGARYDYIYVDNVRKSNDIIADVCAHVHSRGFKFYWIPFDGAYGNQKWKSLGFDRCDIQTGYFWGTPDLIRASKSLKTMQEARKICDRAVQDGMGVEFEISTDLFVPCYGKLKKTHDIERPYEIVKVKDCKKSPSEMRALGYKQFDHNPCLMQRLKNLMTVFEEQGVFEHCNLSYYENYSILRLCNSTDPEIIKIMDRLARHISRRRAR